MIPPKIHIFAATTVLRTKGITKVKTRIKTTMNNSSVTKQEQRTFLRERFLRLLSHLSGQDAKIKMHERTSVSCVLGQVDIDIHHVQVSDLTTPMGNIPNAVLRMSDVISIEVPDLNTSNR
ncbi:gem associated protein 7 [Mytilus galloprovincialis]|uniref:Gem associated protein 7 n=1 Tax=Mytilus galloprovincialis TaxID=29158 RepID=A0A8B6FP71_MYTGA|nr:gem associated protein 7 [Mytilus galloprovincialis]